MQTDKFNTVHELVECINDYWYEYISEGFNFLKKEIHFIADFFPFYRSRSVTLFYYRVCSKTIILP